MLSGDPSSVPADIPESLWWRGQREQNFIFPLGKGSQTFFLVHTSHVGQNCHPMVASSTQCFPNKTQSGHQGLSCPTQMVSLTWNHKLVGDAHQSQMFIHILLGEWGSFGKERYRGHFLSLLQQCLKNWEQWSQDTIPYQSYKSLNIEPASPVKKKQKQELLQINCDCSVLFQIKPHLVSKHMHFFRIWRVLPVLAFGWLVGLACFLPSYLKNHINTGKGWQGMTESSIPSHQVMNLSTTWSQ